MRRMIRGIIESVVEGAIKRIAARGLAGETFSNREFFQHYGLTSRPLEGAECILIREGNHVVVVASDDRRYRISLEDGEVALYDDQGQKVHMKRDGLMDIVCTGTLTANVTDEIVANCSLVTVNASTKVSLNTPLVECSTDVAIGGHLTVGGTAAVQGALSSATSVADPNGTMQGMRNVYGGHDHNENGDGGGVTDSPNQSM